MKSTNFELINPYIEGEFKRIFNGSESIKAAKKCYMSMSEYIRSPIPKFHYTLKNIKTGKYHHFVVREKLKKNNNADFSIEEIKINHTKDELKQFENKLETFKQKNQKGGRRRKYDDSSEDSDYLDDEDSSEYYDRYRHSYPYRTDQPILYYWYEPLLYKINRFYVPHFVLPLSPLVEVNLSSAFFG